MRPFFRMLAAVASATLSGAVGRAVSVEVHVSNGLPGFTIVGLPDAAVREAETGCAPPSSPVACHGRCEGSPSTLRHRACVRAVLASTSPSPSGSSSPPVS